MPKTSTFFSLMEKYLHCVSEFLRKVLAILIQKKMWMIWYGSERNGWLKYREHPWRKFLYRGIWTVRSSPDALQLHFFFNSVKESNCAMFFSQGSTILNGIAHEGGLRVMLDGAGRQFLVLVLVFK